MQRSGLTSLQFLLAIFFVCQAESFAATLHISGITSGGGRYLETLYGAGPGDQLKETVQDGGAIFSTDSLARSTAGSVGVYTGVITSPDEFNPFAAK